MSRTPLPSDIALVFPHQLFRPHPALARARPVVLVEEPLFLGDLRHPARFHKHKLLLHRATLRAYRADLEHDGYTVESAPYDPATTAAETVAALARRGVRTIHVADPVDDVLERRLRRGADQARVTLVVHESPMFLTARDELGALLGPGKRPFMARFYMNQRKRLGVLMDGDQPKGGAWSFDTENRKRLPKGAPVPATTRLPSSRLDPRDIAWVNDRFPDHPGSTATFWYPVTRREADTWLDEFLQRRFAAFGDFEDAISTRHDVLFHSVLTPVLNIGLLTPREVLDRALAFADEHRVPLNSLEGFVRQIIGWREFIRAMYVRHGVAMRNGNFWRHERPLPASFYDGTTGLAPLDLTIRRVAESSWCHHIERLMVVSNAMTLMGIRPHDAYRWFMELFIDAYDWVMVPNVYGMGLFADGGIFATKPYLSGSNYLLKMSDIPRGDWCADWDALFWSFIDRHRAFFAKQHRLSMMVKTLDRMDAATRAAHAERASRFLAELE